MTTGMTRVSGKSPAGGSATPQICNRAPAGVSARVTTRMADIVRLRLADNRRIRRLLGARDEVVCHGGGTVGANWMLPEVWGRPGTERASVSAKRDSAAGAPVMRKSALQSGSTACWRQCAPDRRRAAHSAPWSFLALRPVGWAWYLGAVGPRRAGKLVSVDCVARPSLTAFFGAHELPSTDARGRVGGPCGRRVAR